LLRKSALRQLKSRSNLVTNEPRTISEVSEAELDHVSGGALGRPFLIEGNGNANIHSNAPFTPAAENGFNGNGASILFI
jgi:hypothetical protein